MREEGKQKPSVEQETTLWFTAARDVMAMVPKFGRVSE